MEQSQVERAGRVRLAHLQSNELWLEKSYPCEQGFRFFSHLWRLSSTLR